MEKSDKIPMNKGFQSSGQQTIIQRKIEVGPVDDPLEREADAMADHVMRMPEPHLVQRKCAHCEEEEKMQRKPLASFIQRKCAHCKEEEQAHRKPLISFIQRRESSGHDLVGEGDQISSRIQATRGGGSTMNSTTKSFMESRFGADFSNIKIHTDSNAAGLSKDLNAQAFTIGNDIYFNDGKFSPGSDEGKHLLAHELTHTLQQKTTSAPSTVRRLVRDSLVNCPGHHVGAPDRHAVTLLNNALAIIDRARAARPGDPANADVTTVGNAMHTAFRLSAANAANWDDPVPHFGLLLIRRRIEIVRDYINSVVFTINCVGAGHNHVINPCAAGVCDAGTEAFSCHANPREIALCDLFWTRNGDQRARVYMHEVFHITLRIIDDWGEPDAHNAHCYAQFVALLNGFNSLPGFRCH